MADIIKGKELKSLGFKWHTKKIDKGDWLCHLAHPRGLRKDYYGISKGDVTQRAREDARMIYLEHIENKKVNELSVLELNIYIRRIRLKYKTWGKPKKQPVRMRYLLIESNYSYIPVAPAYKIIGEKKTGSCNTRELTAYRIFLTMKPLVSP